MLSDAMNDLQEQVKVEHVPADKDESGKAVSTLTSPHFSYTFGTPKTAIKI